MDKRIGTYNTDGSIKTMPELSLKGVSFSPTQDRLGIGNGQFVILDRGLTADERTTLVSELLAANTTSTPKTTSTKAINNEP